MNDALQHPNNARNFFSERLQNAMERQQVSAQAKSQEYLVELLVRFMQSDRFFVKLGEGKLENNVLAYMYNDFLQGDLETKRMSLQRLGDICLFVSGFFPNSLSRKVVDVDYYQGMGGTAYLQLSHLQWTELAQTLYRELAEKFKPFCNVLGEVSERSGISNNSDLLRLYERWLLTGSEHLKTLLSEHGIHSPVFFDIKTKH